MRKIVLGAGVALTATFGVSLGLTSAVEARPTNSSLPYQIAQFSDPGISSGPSSNSTISPNLEPFNGRANHYGFVESFDGQNLYVRLNTGETTAFTFPEGVGGADLNLSPGDLVAINANRRNVISGIDTPVVGEEKIGSVSSLVPLPGGSGFALNGVTSAGDGFSQTISEAQAARLQLAQGDEVRVTTFSNFDGLASICKVKRGPFVAPPAPSIPVRPVIPPQPIPVAPPVVEGLW